MLKRLLLAGLASLALALPAWATSVLPLYLDEIVDMSANAFQGTCVSNRSERDAQTGLIVTYTTFQVQDVLKGSVGFTHVIKQIGGELPGESLGFKVAGVPTFKMGESYVLFLPRASSAGFSSPIGLGQGRFSVMTDESGAQVTNMRDFRDLTSRMTLPKSAQSKFSQVGPVRHMSLDDFKQLVRQRVQP